jgi:hypothetical protein
MSFGLRTGIKHCQTANKKRKKYHKNRQNALFFRQRRLNYLFFAIMRRKKAIVA